jgi:virginiamycin A acetyltransferase
MKLSYGRQVTDAGIRQMFRVPLIRFGNGHIYFGRGTVLRGLVTITFGGKVHGRLIIGSHFVGDGDIVLNPRGGSIILGERSFIGYGSVLQAYDGTSIQIGSDVMIANGVTIMASNHGMATGVLMNQQLENGTGVVIQSDVWIGARAVILDGAFLGQGCVVAAGSVVRGRVEPNVIVGGVPARIIGERKTTFPITHRQELTEL